MLAEEPDRYPHVYLGEPDDADADKTVLPYAVLAQCVHAWREGLAPSQADAPLVDGGLDLAEGGADKCSQVIRRGPGDRIRGHVARRGRRPVAGGDAGA